MRLPWLTVPARDRRFGSQSLAASLATGYMQAPVVFEPALFAVVGAVLVLFQIDEMIILVDCAS